MEITAIAAIIFLIISLLIAITFHEAAHAFIAFKLGDPTAKAEGRLTLNPLAHLDPLGTIALILVHFGWGKPVPIDPRNLKHPSRDNFLIAISGPATNIILALIGALLLRFTASIPLAFLFFETFVTLNIILAVFNLLPIPPLDGSKVWHLVLSNESYYTLERLGPIILFAVIIFSFTAGNFLFRFIEYITNWLIGNIT